MKKQTQIKLASGVLLLFSIAIISETGFSRPGDNGNRWEYRFKKDSPKNEAPKTENQGNVGTPINLGNDGAACRDAFIMMSTVFDDTSTTGGKSRLSVPPLNHGQTKSFNCTEPKPVMSNTAKQNVLGGTLVVQCVNGVATLASASCELSPPPAETPPPGGTPPPTPPPNPNDCGNCPTFMGSTYAEYQISKNASGTRKVSSTYRCDNGNYKTVYESGAKPVCKPGKQSQCNSQCDTYGVTTTSTYQISKNASGTSTSTSYKCDNGKYYVVSSKSGSYCK
ncbi:hypothetical protein ACLVWU_07775 [Bdellovibrio sp. HCB290]|uniref:hypothetical protein n=1 Tax=Bdellovibrio sp. HCB290 TaxID=3394356 RepID=UPI0039B5A3B2